MSYMQLTITQSRKLSSLRATPQGRMTRIPDNKKQEWKTRTPQCSAAPLVTTSTTESHCQNSSRPSCHTGSRGCDATNLENFAALSFSAHAPRLTTGTTRQMARGSGVRTWTVLTVWPSCLVGSRLGALTNEIRRCKLGPPSRDPHGCWGMFRSF